MRGRVRTQPDWWVELSAGYLRSLVRRGRRPRTSKAYVTPLLNFGCWLQGAGIKTSSDLSRAHLEAWQDESRAGRLKPGTQRLASVVIRGALKWAADEEVPLSSPTLWLRVVPLHTPEHKPRPIPFRDLAAIWIRLDFWAANPTLIHLRTRALFWAILSSGARISEALSLTRAMVVDGTAMVEQKGGSEHLLVFSVKALTAMDDYLRARTDDEPALFLSYRPFRPLSPLGYDEAQAGWDELCAELAIPRFTSHRVRHSCVTELLRRHVDSLIIAKHVGHRGLARIAGYAEVALDSRREAMMMLDAG